MSQYIDLIIKLRDGPCHDKELQDECVNAIQALESKLAAAEKALRFIEAWELPLVTDRDGSKVPLGVVYGSNGERDYMRNVARQALHAAPSLPTTDTTSAQQ